MCRQPLYPDVLIANALLHNESVTVKDLGDMARTIRKSVAGITPVLYGSAVEEALNKNFDIFTRKGDTIKIEPSKKITVEIVEKAFNVEMPEPERGKVKTIVKEVMEAAYPRTEQHI